MSDEMLSGILGALIGSGVGFLATRWQTREQIKHSRQAEVIKFSLLFNSPEMVQHRINAHHFVEKYMLEKDGKDVEDESGTIRKEIVFNQSTIDSLYKTLPYSELLPLVNIIQFYEHICISIDCKFIDKEYASKVFGSIFLWWWERCLNPKKLDLYWDNKKNIFKLHDYIKEIITDQEYKDWCAAGREFRKLPGYKKPDEH